MKNIVVNPHNLARDLAHYRLMFDSEYNMDDVFISQNGVFYDYTDLGREMYLKYYNNFLLIIKENEETI